MAYQREVRLGLVLYGGVSLAVYENGIAQEIHRAIRGDGVYGLVTKLIDSDIVVDIISGTSAGGVNGIMLAYALANRRSFAPCAELWLEDGDIQKLMRSENDEDPSSILDSDYYQKRLESCYAHSLTHDPTAPTISELDLFITSTDVNGALSTVYDDLGHAVDIKSHRALFKLSFRGNRKNNFAVPAADLARLSRMTSCFPVAFKPVEIKESDENFFVWGKLRSPAIFLDGGILNNKPFTSTIAAIGARTAVREVERFLIYVEPKPEQFDSDAPLPPAPPMVQSGINSLISIPGYQSIAADLQEIEAHNVRAARLQRILSALPDPKDCTDDDLLAATVLLPGSEEADATAYYAARFIQVRDEAVSGILDDDKGRDYFPAVSTSGTSKSTAQDDRRSGRILVQSFDAWPGNGTDTLLHYDIFFRQRRTIHLMDTLMRSTKQGTDVPCEVWDVVNHYFKLYEMVRWAMMRRLTANELPWRTLSKANPTLDTQSRAIQQVILEKISTNMWGQVEALMQPLMYAAITVPMNLTPESRETFYQQLSAIEANPTKERQNVNILDAVDNAFKEALLALQRSPLAASVICAKLLRNEFCRFTEVDRKLFLLQVGSEFESTDLIRIVRFSPLDARRGLSAGDVQNKVRGVALGAFGGFFKKSWRANDIMVGRFDGSCLLIECLLTRERLAALADRRKKAPVSVTAGELLGYLPELKDKAPELANDINNYLADPNNATAEQWNDIINRIVKPCHDEIFRPEYKRVVRCAIEQEHLWGHYSEATITNPSPAGYSAAKQAWIRGQQRPDETIVKIAAEALATVDVEPFAPGLQPANPFTQEIPESILQELGALATTRLGKGLISSINQPGLRQKAAGSRFYRYPFGVLAPTVYGWSKMRRTQPNSVIIFNTLVPTICLVAFALAAAFLYLDPHEWRPMLVVGIFAVLLFIGWNTAFRD